MWPGPSRGSQASNGQGVGVCRSSGEPVVRRVLPSYPVKPALILGLIEAVLGVLMLLLACVVFAVQAFTSTGGSALLAGIGSLSCGISSIISSVKKEVWTVILTETLGMITFVFALILLGASVTGIPKEAERFAHTSVATREAADVAGLFFALVTCIALIWTLIYSSHSLFYGCFKASSGVKYVPDPSVGSEPPAVLGPRSPRPLQTVASVTLPVRAVEQPYTAPSPEATDDTVPNNMTIMQPAVLEV